MKHAYRLIRSTRKTLALEVSLEGEIIVRAPLKTPMQKIEAFVESHAEWLDRAIARQAERRVNHPPLSHEQEEVLRAQAKAYIPERVSHFAPLMGVTPTSVRITSAKKRFGSCSQKNALCFSLYVMQYPPEAIDYVIVHELAHILHHDHSRAFWSAVGTYMPDYPRRRALLKK
jgi:predicted metal-dependent hydrolase